MQPIETKLQDGRTRIEFPDSTRAIASPDGTYDVTFPDGEKARGQGAPGIAEARKAINAAHAAWRMQAWTRGRLVDKGWFVPFAK